MKPPAHERFKASYFSSPRRWRDVHPDMRRRVITVLSEFVRSDFRSAKDEHVRNGLRLAIDELRHAPLRRNLPRLAERLTEET